MPPKTKLCATPDQPSVYNLVKTHRRHRRHNSAQPNTPVTNLNAELLIDRKKRTPPTPPIQNNRKDTKRNKAEMNAELKSQEEMEEEELLGELGELTPELKNWTY